MRHFLARQCTCIFIITIQSINRLERQLSKEESRHKNFVIDFAAKLEKSKKNLSEKEIKNSEQFYLIMRRGE